MICYISINDNMFILKVFVKSYIQISLHNTQPTQSIHPPATLLDGCLGYPPPQPQITSWTDA